MCDDEKSVSNHSASPTNASADAETISLAPSAKDSDPQNITINLYSANLIPKADKPVQTDSSEKALVRAPDCRERKKPGLASESRELRSFEYTSPAFTTQANYASNEVKGKRSMNGRKFCDFATGKATTDVERKKLEAELKATEELAKIQQTVIEKRLALELATIQDGHDYFHKPLISHQSLPQATSKFNDNTTRKPNIIDHVVPQEISSVKRPVAPRPPPPPRLPVVDLVKVSSKPDSSYLSQTTSDLTPLRNLIEKKINLDRISSRTESKVSSPCESPTPEMTPHLPPQTPKPTKKAPYVPYVPPAVEPSTSPRTSNSEKARLMWKTAMKKIKTKVKRR